MTPADSLQADLSDGPQGLEESGAPDMASNVGGRVYGVKGWKSWSHHRRIAYLREMAEAYGRDPRMRWFVVHHVLLPAGVSDFRQYSQVAAALLKWVQDNVYYTNEADEQIQSPWWTLKVKTGDCDDNAVLLATMAHSVRLPWRFVLAGRGRRGMARWNEDHAPTGKVRYPALPKHGWDPTHIYLDLGWPPFTEGKAAKDGLGVVRPLTRWAAAEPTMKGVPLGFDVAEQMAAQERAAMMLARMGVRAGGRGGRSGLPELAGWGQAPAGWGQPGQAPGTALIPASAFHRQVLSHLDGAKIVASIITTGISALFVRWLLKNWRR